LKGSSQPSRQGHERQQLLTEKEEESLMLWCEEYTRAGCPLLPLAVRDMAREICNDCMSPATAGSISGSTRAPIGIYWVRQFLKRHFTLLSVFSLQLDHKMWTTLTRSVIKCWFQAFREVTKRIPLRNIYNLDGTGSNIGTQARARIIIDTGTGTTQYHTHLGRQE
jgi:hypothetical protein